DLGELRSPARDQLEHQQEGDDPGVGLREVAEVVMARNFPAEGRVLLAHAVLDERVSDTVDERSPSSALDRLGYCPARAHVVDDLCAWLLLEDRFREECRREVAGNEVAAVVDEEAAIRVAVERDAEIGVFVQ